MIGNDIWFYGGNRYGYYVPDLFRLDLNSLTFKKFSNEKNVAGRWGNELFYYENSLYSVAGINSDSKETNELVKFNVLPPRRRFWKEFINNEKNSDCKLMIKGREIFAHQFFLSQSPYFYEKLKNENGIEIPDDLNVVIDHILLYLYSRSCIYEEKTIVKLIYASRFFQMEDLENVCYFYLKKLLNSKNLFDLLVESVELKLENVKLIGFKYFWDHSKSNSNVNIPENILVDLLNFQKNPKEFTNIIMKDQFIAHISKFYGEKEFSDMKIYSIDEKEYNVHKIVLDSIENLSLNKKLSSNILEIILNSIYCKKIELSKDIDTLLQLIKACHENNLSQLKDEVIEHLIPLLSPDIILNVLQFLIQNNIDGKIKEICYDLILKHQNLMIRPLIENQTKQNIIIQEQEKKIAVLIKLVENQQSMIDHLSQK